MEVFFFFFSNCSIILGKLHQARGAGTKMGTTSSKRVGVTAPLVFDAFHVM